jgi:hypothetical protein
LCVNTSEQNRDPLKQIRLEKSGKAADWWA